MRKVYNTEQLLKDLGSLSELGRNLTVNDDGWILRDGVNTGVNAHDQAKCVIESNTIPRNFHYRMWVQAVVRELRTNQCIS